MCAFAREGHKAGCEYHYLTPFPTSQSGPGQGSWNTAGDGTDGTDGTGTDKIQNVRFPVSCLLQRAAHLHHPPIIVLTARSTSSALQEGGEPRNVSS